jgi:glucose-6-phosphate 1-dehydrogenase
MATAATIDQGTPLHAGTAAGPCAMVLFGASGDLTKRKLIPALFNLVKASLLPKNFVILGVAFDQLSEEDFRAQVSSFLPSEDRGTEAWNWFQQRLCYQVGSFGDAGMYTSLGTRLAELEAQFHPEGNYLFYLATAPKFFAPIVEQLGAAGLSRQEKGRWRRVIIEKPFGTDLESAKALNRQIKAVLAEEQIYRIDHYLGKETVQNIMALRFGNGIFEPIWNRNFIDHVQITASETLGVEGRGPFYEKAGALRDVVQNHVMELLSFVAMEPPSSFDAEAVRREKVKAWRAIPNIPILNAVRGQYGPGVVDSKKVVGYRDEDRVNPESGTETYAAVKLEIENWRWAGVPFYLRAGKRLKKRATEISIQFKQPPLLIFNRMQSTGPCSEIQPNLLTIRIQPNEGIALRFGAKVPNTPNMSVCPVNMDFDYSAAFGTSTANGYERLLLDAMLGDQTLFAHRDGVEVTWSLYTPILEAWAAKNPEVFPNYFAGSWGPDCGNRLLERDGRAWRNNIG